MSNSTTMKQLGILAIGMIAVASMIAIPSLLQQQAMAVQSLKLINSWTIRPVTDTNGQPYGKETIMINAYKLLGDGSSSYDWYFYKTNFDPIKQETVPGKVVSGWNSNWRNNYMWSKYQVYQYSSSRQLVDYDPSSPTSSSTVSYTATASSSPSFSVGGSYTQNSAATGVCSDLGTSLACWTVDIDPLSTSGYNTWQFKPTFVVRTSQDNWSFVNGSWKVQFKEPSLVFNNLATFPWYSYNALDAQYSGDV